MQRYSRSAALSAGMALVFLAAGCNKKTDTAAAGGTTSGAVTDAAVKVADVKLGRAIGSDKRLTDQTDEFRPSDVIYAVVETQGTGPNTNLQARWTYQDGQLVDQSSRSISAAGEDVTEFHIQKPGGWPKGKYTVAILLNGNQADSKEFEVK